MDKPPNQNSRKKPLSQPNQFLKYSNLAFQLLIIFGVAVWGGVELDAYLEFKFPLFTLVFILSALTAVIYKLIKVGQSN